MSVIHAHYARITAGASGVPDAILFGKFLHCQAASIGFHDVFHAIRSAIERILTLYVSKFTLVFCHNIDWYQFGITRANTIHARML
jgi:hypothetical protein